MLPQFPAIGSERVLHGRRRSFQNFLAHKPDSFKTFQGIREWLWTDRTEFSFEFIKSLLTFVTKDSNYQKCPFLRYDIEDPGQRAETEFIIYR
jgi:hypothetical protein